MGPDRIGYPLEFHAEERKQEKPDSVAGRNLLKSTIRFYQYREAS
jgi:hypothetical protein